MEIQKEKELNGTIKYYHCYSEANTVYSFLFPNILSFGVSVIHGQPYPKHITWKNSQVNDFM